MGGDEFLVIFWDCNLEKATVKMNKQVARMAKKGIVFSFGIAEWKKANTVAEVVHEADEKMYEMKRKRR
jgi:GGDEF domain-containing protein